MDFRTPLLITNFKTYQEGSASNALALAKIHERVANETGLNLMVAVQAVDLAMVSAGVSIPVLAQHVDPVTYGPYTGHLAIDILKSFGVDGSIVNHSERPISEEQIGATVEKLRELGMLAVVCAETADEGEEYMSKFKPDFIALEPPELIGGEISVSQDRPDHIQEAVERIGKGKVLVGAGVKTAFDVQRALELGAVGVLVASGVVKSPNPMEALRDLCKGFMAV